LSNSDEVSFRQGSDGSNRIVLGKLMRTQGLDGGIRFLPYYGDFDQFTKLNFDECVFYWTAPSTQKNDASLKTIPLKVVSCHPHQQFIILQFANYDDIDSVRSLTNGELSIDTAQMWPPEEGEYREYELIGMKVVDSDSGHLFGTVAGLEDGMAHSYLRVAPAEDGKKSFVIPFVGAMVLSISRDSREVLVSLPDGLTDL